MGKPRVLFRCLEEEKCGMDADFFDEEQLLDVENDDVREAEDAQDVEFQGIDVVTCENNNGLWVVPQEHSLKVLRQHHESQVAGHWGRHQT